MIHYHGLPITPQTAAVYAVKSGHAFVSFMHQAQVAVAVEAASSFALDNGAFSAWRRGQKIHWPDYYAWVAELKKRPGFDFAVIPDVIDGDEDANDRLLEEWPHGFHVGAPVWHLHESIERLVILAQECPRVCLGSSGQFSKVGSADWWARMTEAMDAICVDGLPICKLHGLRMLNPKIFEQFPFASADSTNIARNIGIDSAWKGTYTPMTKDARALDMRQRIEHYQAAVRWEGRR